MCFTLLLLKNMSLKLALSAFVLGFGGISVTLQVLSIISNDKLSIKKYVLGRILVGVVASVYTFILFSISPLNTADPLTISCQYIKLY